MSKVEFFDDNGGFQELNFNGNLSPVTHAKVVFGELIQTQNLPPTPYEGNTPPKEGGGNRKPKSRNWQNPGYYPNQKPNQW